MGSDRKKSNIVLPVALAVCLFLAVLAGGSYFAGYLKKQIFAERTTQLNEITLQVQSNLNNALDAHWNYLVAAANLLENQEYDTVQDIIRQLKRQEQILETDHYNSKLILLEDRGNCCDAGGRRSVWSDIDRVSGGEERYTFISDTEIYDGSYWA